MAKYKSGEAFIEILNAHGVDKVFINQGFEHNAIQISVASARLKGRKSPQLVLCLDESVIASEVYGKMADIFMRADAREAIPAIDKLLLGCCLC